MLSELGGTAAARASLGYEQWLAHTIPPPLPTPTPRSSLCRATAGRRTRSTARSMGACWRPTPPRCPPAPRSGASRRWARWGRATTTRRSRWVAVRGAFCGGLLWGDGQPLRRDPRWWGAHCGLLQGASVGASILVGGCVWPGLQTAPATIRALLLPLPPPLLLLLLLSMRSGSPAAGHPCNRLWHAAAAAAAPAAAGGGRGV